MSEDSGREGLTRERLLWLITGTAAASAAAALMAEHLFPAESVPGFSWHDGLEIPGLTADVVGNMPELPATARPNTIGVLPVELEQAWHLATQRLGVVGSIDGGKTWRLGYGPEGTSFGLRSHQSEIPGLLHLTFGIHGREVTEGEQPEIVSAVLVDVDPAGGIINIVPIGTSVFGPDALSRGTPVLQDT